MDYLIGIALAERLMRRTVSTGTSAPQQETDPMDWKPIEEMPEELKDGREILLGRAPDLNEDPDDEGVASAGWWQDAEPDGPDYMGADAGFADGNYFMPGRSFGNPKYRYAARQPTHYAVITPPETE